MFHEQTHRYETVQVQDAVETGRILVIDDDRSFGGFMLAALETRGHTTDWAACITDGLAYLYTERYDLVIIDLRLPDGSGLDFLRAATDDGLLNDAAAIILTGHNFEEPQDIRVYHKPIELDPFLDRMGAIVAHAKRRRRQTARGGTRQASYADDRERLSPRHKIDLVLYTSPSSEKCQRAIRTIENVLERYNQSQVKFAIRDLSAQGAHLNNDDAVVFTPTLVKRGPGPRTWIVGNLDQPELLVDLLEVSGVERKR